MTPAELMEKVSDLIDQYDSESPTDRVGKLSYNLRTGAIDLRVSLKPQSTSLPTIATNNTKGAAQ